MSQNTSKNLEKTNTTMQVNDNLDKLTNDELLTAFINHSNFIKEETLCNELALVINGIEYIF